MKRKLALAGTILFVVFVVIVILGIAVWVDSLHVSQPKLANIDLRALMPTRVEIPAESNGFALLIQAGSLLKVSGNESIFGNYTNWIEAEAQDLLASNEAAMSTMHEAWKLPYLQVDAITNADQDFKYLGDWKHLGQLEILEARLTFNRGNEMQAFEGAMDVVRFGQRIQQAEGNVLDYLMGRSIKSLGFQNIQRFADTTTLAASNLVSILKELTNFEASQDALRETLRVEYSLGAMNFDGLNTMIATSSVPMIATGSISVYSTKFVYDSDRSKRELAAQTLNTMYALTNSYAAGVGYLPAANTNSSFSSFMVRFLHGNAFGTILNDMTVESRSKMLAQKCRENMNVRATRTILALRAFQMVNHRPANSLQELVPDFLDAVPLDDFDGKPLRYNPNLKEVYSVGTDLKDAGGIKSTNSTNIIFPFKL